jgi:Carbohydrate family 9 binding domain-like
MKRLCLGVCTTLLLGFAGAAHANAVWIDFTGPQVVRQGLTQVNNAAGKDGETTIVKMAGVNTAKTGGTDAAGYLYLKISPVFKADLQSVWVTVDYFDQGTNGFRLEYDGTGSTTAASRPAIRYKYDTMGFTSQTWHLVNFNLKGGQEGGADLRINDRASDAAADGEEYVARVVVSDTDPNFSYFPYATTKPTIDGKIDAGEWDEAGYVVLDSLRQDGYGSARTGFKVPEDFSGVYFFKYDETNLYVMGMVRDATPRYNSNLDPTRYYAGDGVQVYFGLDDSNPERASLTAGSDFNIQVSLGPNPGISLGGRDLDSVNNLKVQDTADGYQFELRLPWTSLDASAKAVPGQRVAWYLFANNSITEDPSNQDLALGPTGITGPSSYPWVWIRGVLDLNPNL